MSYLIPVWVMVIVAVLLWLAVSYLFWIKPHLIPKLQNYFAQRRHIRRMRNRALQGFGNELYGYTQRDINLTMRMFKALPNPANERLVKEVPRAAARHRR